MSRHMSGAARSGARKGSHTGPAQQWSICRPATAILLLLLTGSATATSRQLQPRRLLQEVRFWQPVCASCARIVSSNLPCLKPPQLHGRQPTLSCKWGHNA